jgi:KaiC/GvpD/RAD55 family RecA-like ATPase
MVNKKRKKSKKKVAPRPKKSSKKSPIKRIRITTGIGNLDPLIQGGLKQNHINLLIGDAGAGKTIFSLQFLMEGLKKGETCLYITFEEKKEKLYDDMRSFGWDLEGYEEKKKLFFLEYNPEQVKSLIEEGGGTIDHLISKSKVSRLVIDSITSFSLLYQDELAKKEAGLALFELINKWGCTAVLTAQDPSHTHSLKGTNLEFEADGIIILYHLKLMGQRVRALEILKMRGTNHVNKTMQMNISNKGIVINPSRIIKL